MAYTTQIGHRTSIAAKAQTKRGGLHRLLVCSVLFFLAVIAKISGVPAVSDTISAWIDMGTLEEGLAVLGMSVTAPELSVTEVFSDWAAEVFASETAEKGEIVPVSAEPAPQEASSELSVVDTPEVPMTIVPVDATDPDPELLAASMAAPQGHISIGDATEYSLPVEETETSTDLPLPEVVSAESVSLDFGYVTPVRGYITSAFGYRDHPLDGEYKFHYGVDIGAAEGTEILAFADGVVNTVLVGEINGNYFKVQHDDGIVSMYAHCQKIAVKPGQRVKKGDVIAYVGQTGQVSGPHLHFQLYRNGKIIDPTEFLEVAV